MLDASVPLRTANYSAEHERDFPVLSLAAVVVWALSLAIGLFELAVGNEGVGIAALIVSVVAPWLGLALAHYPAVARRLRRLNFRRRKVFEPIGVTLP